jgi:hypothetical protein
MRPVQLARLVKNNDLQAASPHWGEFAFGFKAAAKRPLEDNKGENKQEQARIKPRRFDAGNKSKRPAR